MYFTSSIPENIIQSKRTNMPLQVNTARGTTSDPIGIFPLLLDINDHTFIHNFIICKKLKQPLIIGLDFTQCYKIGLIGMPMEL